VEDGHQFLHQEDTIIDGAIIELLEGAFGLLSLLKSWRKMWNH
jgi:hypothetical protein